ncbi:hypothetical protein D1867_04615 [Acidianus infernus]|uniref:Uncharacterized protein n=1 Tax=Acidianus infernus TaxID=12915 RepID=A0A6A9QBH0_ACIIN|nr:hypothetical protein [Acidianus infernus]MUM64541.1 hypothetical protein [Acidianus infernus]
MSQQQLEVIAEQSADYEYNIYNYFVVKQQNSITAEELEQYPKIALMNKAPTLTQEDVKCQVQGNSEAYSGNKFWLYPAIIIPETISSSTKSLVDIIRQGIVITSNEEGILYFIGGCVNYNSGYWRSGKYLIFQGGAQFGAAGRMPITMSGGTRINTAALKEYAKTLTEESLQQICVIPILSRFSNPASGWINPTYYRAANNVSYEESVNELILPSATAQLLTYQPELNHLAIKREKDFYYRSDTSTYISKSLPDQLLDISSRFPYPYPAYYTSGIEYTGNFPTQLFLGYLRVVIVDFPKQSPFYSNDLLYPEFYNGYSSDIFMLNNMSIGAPVYLSKYNPNNGKPCTDYGVLGLVSAITNFNADIKGNIVTDRSLLSQLPSDFIAGYYILTLVKAPEPSNIDQYIKWLGQENAVNMVLDGIRKAKRAISSLISSGILAGIAFSAVMAVEEWESEDQITRDAKPYVDKLNKLYNEALNYATSCIESLPNLPRNAKIIYIQQVQQYLSGLMYEVNAEASEEDILSWLESEIQEYLSNQGIIPACP